MVKTRYQREGATAEAELSKPESSHRAHPVQGLTSLQRRWIIDLFYDGKKDYTTNAQIHHLATWLISFRDSPRHQPQQQQKRE